MRLPLLIGALCLAGVWLGPLPELARHSFAAHMTLHIAVVAVAAPLIAWGLAGGRFDPVRRAPWLFAPIPASVLELIVVWGWHAPAPHHAARESIGVFALEQATFLAAGLLLWLSAVGGATGHEDTSERATAWRRWSAAGSLLFTSMHMTLLGALFTVALRPLYVHATGAARDLSPMLDQQLGGAIMLIVGGLSYLTGALWLLAGGLRLGDPRVSENLRADRTTRGF